MFERLTIRGPTATIAAGYHTAAVLGPWTITREGDRPDPPRWRLDAAITSADAYQLRGRALVFAAPRKGGFWSWPLLTPPVIINGSMTAELGPPVQG